MDEEAAEVVAVEAEEEEEEDDLVVTRGHLPKSLVRSAFWINGIYALTINMKIA